VLTAQDLRITGLACSQQSSKRRVLLLLKLEEIYTRTGHKAGTVDWWKLVSPFISTKFPVYGEKQRGREPSLQGQQQVTQATSIMQAAATLGLGEC
jgi:hypothetical protein